MQDRNEIERVIKLTLIRIGIKCDLVGFTYLARAITLVVESPAKLHNLSKLVKEVAEMYAVKNPFRVEANIQNALTQTYNIKTFSALNELYGMKVVKDNYKPTTAEFINLVAEYYSMGLYKKDVNVG